MAGMPTRVIRFRLRRVAADIERSAVPIADAHSMPASNRGALATITR